MAQKDDQETAGADAPKESLERKRYRKRYFAVLRSTIGTVIVVAAVAVLASNLLLSVLRIYGNTMSPTLEEGQIVLARKGTGFEKGDLVAFDLGDKLLVKRCIAGPGEWVNIDQEGNVYVDNELLQEPYLTEKAFGECNIMLPYQVPENRWFLLGDNRAVSLDSRSTSIGCVAEEQIVGKLVWRIWPLSQFGPVR